MSFPETKVVFLSCSFNSLHGERKRKEWHLYLKFIAGDWNVHVQSSVTNTEHRDSKTMLHIVTAELLITCKPTITQFIPTLKTILW